MKAKNTAATSLVLAAIGLTVIGTAAGQERGDRDGPFADGVLTRAEALAQAEDRFGNVDLNADGYVSQSEADAAKARADERRAERQDEGRKRRKGRKGGKSGERGDRFTRHDTDEDGFVSRDEAVNAALARFDRADADGDGEVTREEMRAGRRGQRGNR